MKCVVNPLELLVYYSIWTLTIIFGLFKLFEAQTDILSKNPHYIYSQGYITPGWTFLNRNTDVSDVTWRCWLYFIRTSWFYLLVQYLISEILRQCNMSIKYWNILSSIFLTSYCVGIKSLFTILIQPVMFYTVVVCGGKRIIIWIMAVLILIYFISEYYNDYLWHMYEDEKIETLNLCNFANGWTALRCVSYCLDFIEKQEKVTESGDTNHKENKLQNFINMQSYVLYYPVLLMGPIIMYRDFENSFLRKSQKLLPRIKRFAVDVIIYSIYTFLLELSFHFIYFNAMIRDEDGVELIKTLPSFELAAGGLWMFLTFYVKYVIIYGTASAFSRLDDKDSPPTPRCVLRIHVYSDMWRYFDVGLHKFLLEYITKPCFSTLCKYTKLPQYVCRQIASISPFALMGLWHGLTSEVLIWCALNYTGTLSECIATALSTTVWYNTFKAKVLKTEAMEARFIATLCCPLLLNSIISNLYFFGRLKVGHLYLGRLAWPALHNFMLALVNLYSCCQVSMSLVDVPARSDQQRLGLGDGSNCKNKKSFRSHKD